MSRPVYVQGPPVASQTWSTRLAFRRGTSVRTNLPLIRASAAQRPTKSSITAVMAALPPRRSYSDPAIAQPPSGASPTTGQPRWAMRRSAQHRPAVQGHDRSLPEVDTPHVSPIVGARVDEDTRRTSDG